GSASREYDGSVLACPDVAVGGDGFAPGEGASFTVTGSQKLVGAGNAFSYEPTGGAKESNYDISTSYGTLTVEPRAQKYLVEVASNGLEAVYDGTPKTASGLVATSFEVDGHTYAVLGLSAETTRTDAGSYDNAVSGTPVVTDSDGDDVTSEFEVIMRAGRLVISQRDLSELAIDSISDQTYTGEALTPPVSIAMGDRTLVAETDYETSYTNNVIPGTATVTITGIGNYTGTATASFEIKQAYKTSTTQQVAWKRLAGATAPDTMKLIAGQFGKAKVAVVTTDANYKDALAASALAGKNGAIVLMTKKGSLTA
ncbi:MAG: cell wall-binding repeat-containing protein, partial [Coriobacteriales bacterium]